MSSRRLWFVLALVIALGSALALGHARAQTPYTPDSLTAMLLSTSDVNAMVSPDQVTDVSDGSPQSDTLVRVVRLFKTNQAIIAVTLFAHADGSAPTADQQNLIQSGQYLQDLANGIFSGVTGFTLGGSTGAADADQIALFTGSLNGASWDSVGDSFVKGNVFGAVLYTTPGMADGATLGLLLAQQLSTLH